MKTINKCTKCIFCTHHKCHHSLSKFQNITVKGIQIKCEYFKLANAISDNSLYLKEQKTKPDLLD